MPNYHLRTGKVVGLDHALSNRNAQDGFATKVQKIGGATYFIGAISDGCSEGDASEVSGHLLPMFIVSQVAHYLEIGMPIIQISTDLYHASVGFLDVLVKQFQLKDQKDIVSFIKSQLLATVIGFVIGPEDGAVFYAGDGWIVINSDPPKLIDYDNKSPYIAYHLIPRWALLNEASPLPQNFEIIPINTAKLDYLAIASDGFSQILLKRLKAEPKPIPLGIQLWMQWVNGPRNPQRQKDSFRDDAVVIELKKEA